MTTLSRRTFLAAGAAAVAVACSDDAGEDPVAPSPPDEGSTTSAAADSGATTTSAAPDSGATTTTVAPDGSALGPDDFAALATCVLLPAATAGPFPLDEQFVRRDITEGYPGHPLRLGIRTVDATCEPRPGAAVEIWHCDATGDYSAFDDGGNGKDESEGTTFLRGTQIADDDGIVEFATIYPGWYPGRAVHIHLRVRVDDELVLTGQLYFDDDYTAGVFGDPVYVDNGLPDTTNATDRIARDVATDGSGLTLRPEGDGTLGLINVGVAV